MKSEMTIVWGIISSMLGIGGGIIYRNPLLIVAGITIGFLTCLRYAAIKRKK